MSNNERSEKVLSSTLYSALLTGTCKSIAAENGNISLDDTQQQGISQDYKNGSIIGG